MNIGFLNISTIYWKISTIGAKYMQQKQIESHLKILSYIYPYNSIIFEGSSFYIIKLNICYWITYSFQIENYAFY